MRIVKTGRIPATIYRGTCSWCGCQVELDRLPDGGWIGRLFRQRPRCYVNCPTCGKNIGLGLQRVGERILPTGGSGTAKQSV